jgi:hypothetical protein
VFKVLRYRSKWLAILILVIAAALLIGGCPSTVQPSTYLPPPSPPAAVQSPTGQPGLEPSTAEEPLVNRLPVIDKLSSEYSQVKRSTTTPVKCSASDPDGDALSYVWSASGGAISGEGEMVSWKAPEKSGTYTITVAVTDGRGGQVTATIDIKAACCPVKADE